MITIIILAYVANVFLTRWLNKVVYKRSLGNVVVLFWFIPIATTIVFTWIILEDKIDSSNWFTGKNW